MISGAQGYTEKQTHLQRFYTLKGLQSHKTLVKYKFPKRKYTLQPELKESLQREAGISDELERPTGISQVGEQ